MNVKRKMIILSGGDTDLKGVLKLDKIGGRVACTLNVYGDVSGGKIYLKNGDKYMSPVEIKSSGTDFELLGDDLSNDIECLLADSGRIILSGATGADRVGNTALILETEKRYSSSKARFGDSVERAEPYIASEKAVENVIETQAPPAAPEPEFFTAPQMPKQSARTDSFHYTTDFPFYDAVRLQLEELFSLYPEEEILKKSIPESDWAHIKFDESEYYVVGVIKEDGKPRYICYGVPADRKIMPESEVTEHCDWICVNPENPDDGYYMMYQDAISGETMRK